MKRFILALIICLVFGSAYAFEPKDWMDKSAVNTADAAIATGTGWFYGFVIYTDGTNSVTVDIYDNTSGTGTKLAPSIVCQTSSTNRTCVFGADVGIVFNTGLYIDITSSDATPDYVVYYRSK